MDDPYVEGLALALLNSHYRANGLSDQTELGAFDDQYRRDARTALKYARARFIPLADYTALTALVEEMAEQLTTAREAIASLPEFALGGVDLTDTHTGEPTGQYGVRDELLSNLDATLTKYRETAK